MKKLMILAVMSGLLAVPALGQSMTISFAADDGSEVVLSLDGAGNGTTASGETFAYSWDEESRKLCGNPTGEGEVCATFEDTGLDPEVGQSAGYTASDGSTGTATILELSQ